MECARRPGAEEFGDAATAGMVDARGGGYDGAALGTGPHLQGSWRLCR